MTELVGACSLAVGLAILIGTGVLAASCLRPRSALELILSAYVLCWLWLVAVVYALSPLGLVTRGWLVAGLVAGLGLALLAWNASGRPRPPSLESGLELVSIAMRRPAVAVLALAVLAGFAYSVALALFTPVNEGDSLAYHLVRVAFWKQEQQIGYVPGAVDLRVDVSPPNVEIGQLATVLLSGGDRYVALPQLFAYVALVLGVAGIARRAGFHGAEAIFGALVFAALPIVVIQASGALNDLVVASFLTVATFFVLTQGRRFLLVFAVAVGLALGTKVTAVLALPTLLVLALVARPRRDWPALFAAGAAGVVIGSAWYVLNVVETGSIDGGLGEAADQRVEPSAAAIVVNGLRYGLDLLDMSGALTPASRLFLFVGLGLATLSAISLRSSRRAALSLAGAAVLTVSVLAIPALAAIGRDVVFRFWIVVGRPVTPRFETGWDLNRTADPADSWFGPLGAPLLLVGAGVVLVLWRRERVPLTALVLALAPLALLATFAAVVIWDPWRGRFLAFGVALAAATWGLLLRWPVTAAAVPAIAVAGLALSLANYQGKPSGLGAALGVRSLYGVPVDSIWGTERVEAQTMTRQDKAEETVLRFVEREIDSTAHVAVAPRENDFLYPYFGPRLTRRVALVRPRGVAPRDADWLVLTPSAQALRCADAWRPELTLEAGWQVERRVAPDSCVQRVSVRASKRLAGRARSVAGAQTSFDLARRRGHDFEKLSPSGLREPERRTADADDRVELASRGAHGDGDRGKTFLELAVDLRPPLPANSPKLCAQRPHVRDRSRRERGERAGPEERFELVGPELREHDLAGGRGVQRHLDADPVGDADVPLRVELQEDVHSRPPARHGETRRLTDRVAKLLENRPGDVDDAPGRVGRPREADELVAENPCSAVGRLLDEPEVRQRAERPRGGRAWKVRRASKLGRR